MATKTAKVISIGEWEPFKDGDRDMVRCVGQIDTGRGPNYCFIQMYGEGPAKRLKEGESYEGHMFKTKDPEDEEPAWSIAFMGKYNPSLLSESTQEYRSNNSGGGKPSGKSDDRNNSIVAQVAFKGFVDIATHGGVEMSEMEAFMEKAYNAIQSLATTGKCIPENSTPVKPVKKKHKVEEDEDDLPF